jgi:hypothetical protein
MKKNVSFRHSLGSMDNNLNPFSTLIDDFSNTSLKDKTTDYLNKVRENVSNSQCADCNSDNPTIAIMSWLLVICKKCAGRMVLDLFFFMTRIFIYSSCSSSFNFEFSSPSIIDYSYM